MSYYQRLEEMNYMAEEAEMVDFIDEMVGGAAAAAADGVEDVEADEYDLITKVTDTSSGQARNGQDIQGIPWERLNISRENYRSTRLEQYKNYENIPLSGEAVDKECKQMEKGGHYYEFFYNTRSVKPTILHFQLRNLVWATSKHDVYLMSNYSVMHWSSISGNLSEVIDFAGHVAPSERLDRQGVSFCTRTTYDDNAITNAIEIYDSMRGGIHFMSSNNDGGLREYDLQTFQPLNHFHFPWPVNSLSDVKPDNCYMPFSTSNLMTRLACILQHTSVSPDRRLIAVVGDNVDGLLVDSQSGKTVSTVEGHLDYSFASAWHPDGRVFATGNQDKTCRVWDIRKLSSPTAILKGNLGAVRSICFSSDGQFMYVAEPADFVHVYSTQDDYRRRQEIDFFGEISGVALSPDDESLYIGIWDRTYASLLQYNKRHSYGYLDSYL
ncbi:hypothetical protein DKX38_003473 [Salix brachista]|uniref:Uncharacterized protein n=1 Tax=Salix brachista TaxID=2182728 RepID=A0A5N5NPZ0_9ROSI|nr:hypothetical protein DKX38_003473 [Salix brachista]